jgi:hypothetical protein
MPSQASAYNNFNQPTTALLNPLDVEAKRIAIRNALAAGSLQDQQIQGGAMDLQQRQRDMANEAQFRALYNSQPGAGTPPPVGAPAHGPGVDPLTGTALPPPPPAAVPPPTPAGAAPPQTAAHDIPDSQILGALGTKGYALIHARNEASKLAAETQETQGKLTQQNKDYWGSLAYGISQSNYNPTVIQATLSKAAAEGKQNTPEFQQFAQAVQSGNPNAVKTLAQTAIDNSGEQQKLLNERTTASAAMATAAEKTQSSNRQANDDADKRASALLASTKADPKAYAQVYASLDPATIARNNFDTPAQWTPASAGKAQQMGLSSQEQVTTAEAARRDTQTAANENARLRVEQSRLSIEQNKAKGALGSLTPNDQAIAAKLASGEFNPALLGRMPNKEGIVAGAISLNPAWTPQIYDVKKSFKEGADSTAIGGMARVLGHLDSYAKNSADLGFSPTALVGIKNGTDAQTRVARDASAISEEFGKLVKSNALTQTEADRYESALTSSREGIRSSAVDEITNLMKAQFEAKYQKYKTGTGSVLPADEFFDKHTMGLLQAHGALPDGYVAPGSAPAPSAAPAPAPSAPHGIPELGSTFNGHKVLKVTRIN